MIFSLGNLIIISTALALRFLKRIKFVRKPLVLVVLENSKQLNLIRTCLKKERYKVHTAASSTEAFLAIRKNKPSIFLCDEGIPEKGGLAFLRQIKNRYPDTVRCLMTSSPESPQVMEAVHSKEICSSLQKPWKQSDLIRTIHDCEDRFTTAEANRESMKVILSAFHEEDRPRNQDLLLSTAILNVLPQGAVVLNEDLSIKISNDIYNLKIAVEAGTAGSELPLEIKESITRELKEGWKEARFPLQVRRNSYFLRIRPLRETDSRTAILFFDPAPTDS